MPAANKDALLSALGDMHSERLDHHGIVAATCDLIDLVRVVDEILPTERKVSHGLALKAMVVNALAVCGRPLYLTPEFFKGKPIERLIASGLCAGDFNDDMLGRTLDALFEAGVTEVFARISAQALKGRGITPQTLHLDSSSFSFHGAYDNVSEDPHVIEITRGYSKDQRPDLKQMVVELICCERSNLPVWLSVLNGNSSDKTSFTKTIGAYIQGLSASERPCFVADSALYSAGNIKELEGVDWITRVPGTLSAVKEIYDDTKLEDFEPVEGHEGYHFIQYDYDDPLPQRWVLIFSAAAHEREMRTLQGRIEREHADLLKTIRKLKRRSFNCEVDADEAIQAVANKLKLHALTYRTRSRAHYSKPGRPSAGAVPDRTSWELCEIEIVRDEEAIEAQARRSGKFVLATNVLDTEYLDNAQVLARYKAQGISVERGFRFLKDPRFFADGMYLKKPQRIMAMTMIMGLSLLVYALAERRLREALRESGETIPSQTGQPTDKPTMRRVFEIFEGIEVLRIEVGGHVLGKVLNLNPLRVHILRVLGPAFEKYYRDG